MVHLTPEAIAKVKEFIAKNTDPVAVGLRIGVQGGGCSGFSYKLVLVTAEDVNPDWTVLEIDGLKVFIDQMSGMYLEGTTIDFITAIESSGFKFTNPSVKSTCGCGSSFSA